MADFSDFLEVQTSTNWGRTLVDFASFCVPVPGMRILDVGCGPGLLPALFLRAGCSSIGVDLDFKLLQGHLASMLVQADAFSLPFPRHCFDLITSTNVLFMLKDPFKALQAWALLLRSGGMLCLLNPSEMLSTASAKRLADERGLQGTARDSLLS